MPAIPTLFMYLAMLVFPIGMAWAAASDLLTMRISNRLVILLALGFCIVALAVNIPLQQFGLQLACAFAVLAVGFTLFAFRFIGGGDAKFAAATALWLDYQLMPQFLVYAGLLGGLLTLAILALRSLPLMPILARFSWLERLHDKKSGVPYGIALALAGMLVYTSSTIFERLTV